MKSKVIASQDAVRMIQSGKVVAINGFGPLGQPDLFSTALRDLYLSTGTPKNLTLVIAAGQGIYDKKSYLDKLALDGLFTKMIAGHYRSMLSIADMVVQEKIEAYNIPMGIISQMFREMAGRKPGIISKIGLKTFCDPRLQGGRLNALSKEHYVELMNIGDEEYLFYKAFPIDYAIIRGTTADPAGNITMEKEAVILDGLSMAQAAKANGGKVIVQVERLSEHPAVPKEIKIPGIIVDAIIVDPDQRQSFYEEYNSCYTGETRVPAAEIPAVFDLMAKRITSERTLIHHIIARRAVEEVGQDNVVNFGAGIPELVGWYIKPDLEATLTVESGIIGGIPMNGAEFGAAINPMVIYDQPFQFDFYDGGGLDVTFLGALEIDAHGNINVSQAGKSVVGIGGFINISQNSKKVVFCFPFSVKGLEVDFSDGRLQITHEGAICKFQRAVQQVSFSGEYALDTHQTVLYVTERCVFKLVPSGLELVEVAPGIDIQKQIVDIIPFEISISPELKVMDSSYFIKPGECS
jgi:propionate CoA-transferase